jgi:hypothetical protein
MSEPKRPDLVASPGEVIPLPVKFENVGSRAAAEREKRTKQAQTGLTFGVPFLDRALGGIFPNDLVLIGAKTGVGKTTFATMIAQVNAIAGKRVHYFALEAEPLEIERRIKFNLLARRIRKHISGDHDDVNYLDWYMGRIEHKAERFEAEVNEIIAKNLSTLHTYYREADFYAENFEQMVTAIQGETDLIILDHLHYVDTDDANENRGYKKIVKKIRDVALLVGKPMVVVAHVRKGDRRNAQVVPGLEDFHGTSDVPKIATKAVMIAAAFDQNSGDPCLWPTYISPAKCRFEGSRTRYVGLCSFDVRTGLYEEDFALGRVSLDGSTWETEEQSRWPEWARRRQ